MRSKYIAVYDKCNRYTDVHQLISKRPFKGKGIPFMIY